MSGYQAVLMAPDGDYVTDYSADTVEGVWEAANEGGSRWCLYPFAAVVEGGAVADDSRIVEAADFYEGHVAVFGGEWKGESLGDLRQHIRAEVERARRLVPCPRCHGAGRVDPAEVEA